MLPGKLAPALAVLGLDGLLSGHAEYTGSEIPKPTQSTILIRHDEAHIYISEFL